MTVFSIVFLNLQDKRIFLWMDMAENQDEAFLRSQKEFESMGIDPKNLAIVAIKGMEIKEVSIGKREEKGESALAGFEAFRKDHGLETVKKKTRKKKV